jgi:hypothetical protein
MTPRPLTRRQLLIGSGLSVLTLTAASARHRGIHVSSPTDASRTATNLAVVQRYCAAWRAGDRQALAALYHDEFTLHYFGRNSLAGVHAGKPASLKVLLEFGRRTNRQLPEIVDAMAGPQRAAVIAREAFARGDLRAELERLLVYSIKDALLHHCWIYDADQALVDRFLADS